MTVCTPLSRTARVYVGCAHAHASHTQCACVACDSAVSSWRLLGRSCRLPRLPSPSTPASSMCPRAWRAMPKLSTAAPTHVPCAWARVGHVRVHFHGRGRGRGRGHVCVCVYACACVCGPHLPRPSLPAVPRAAPIGGRVGTSSCGRRSETGRAAPAEASEAAAAKASLLCVQGRPGDLVRHGGVATAVGRHRSNTRCSSFASASMPPSAAASACVHMQCVHSA